MRILNLVCSIFYTVAPVQERSREFSEEIVTNTQCKLCVPYINQKDNSQLQKAHITLIFSLKPMHSTYSYYTDLDLSCSETNAAVTLSTQYSNFHLGQTLALGIVLMQ